MKYLVWGRTRWQGQVSKHECFNTTASCLVPYKNPEERAGKKWPPRQADSLGCPTTVISLIYLQDGNVRWRWKGTRNSLDSVLIWPYLGTKLCAPSSSDVPVLLLNQPISKWPPLNQDEVASLLALRDSDVTSLMKFERFKRDIRTFQVFTPSFGIVPTFGILLTFMSFPERQITFSITASAEYMHI